MTVSRSREIGWLCVQPVNTPEVAKRISGLIARGPLYILRETFSLSFSLVVYTSARSLITNYFLTGASLRISVCAVNTRAACE